VRTTRLAASAVAALAVIAGLSGCGKDEEDHSAHASSTTATPPPPAPSPIRTVDPTQPPVTTTSSVPPVPPPVVDDVNCGPVTDAGGATRTVIAVGTADGRPGCTEAINVATTYVTTIAPSDSVMVQGWQCNSQPDTQVPQVCSKDGLVIALRAS
jgi:hypothetical protein